MKFDAQLERSTIRALQKNPDEHLVFEPEAYRPDGRIVIHRDNLSGITLHRFLYRRLVGALDRYEYLERGCEMVGCVNPHHFHKMYGLRRGPVTHCPKGHEYTKENIVKSGRNRCRECLRERQRLPNEGRNPIWDYNRAKVFCPRGHRYTDENTYLHYDRRGRPHRKCRTCQIKQTRARNARSREQKEQENDSQEEHQARRG